MLSMYQLANFVSYLLDKKVRHHISQELAGSSKSFPRVIDIFTAISIKVVHPKAESVNYKRARYDVLIFIFSSKSQNYFFETASKSHRIHKRTTAKELATKVISRVSGPK